MPEYKPLERIAVPRPVDRIDWIVQKCVGKNVVDLGCVDETAGNKKGTDHWLHARIARAAKCVIGVDNSNIVPPEGVVTGGNSKIVKGDVTTLGDVVEEHYDIEVIVAGELIEHLENTLSFLRMLRNSFPGRTLVASTPNATSVTNVLLGVVGRESTHRDHLQVYSYKTLNTLCRRAEMEHWEIVPYHVRYTEMILHSTGLRRQSIRAAERSICVLENLFPLLAGGLILHVPRL